MAALDDAIAKLRAEVTAEMAVIDSAIKLFSELVPTVATPAQLQQLADLATTITAKSGELAAAVTAHTPPVLTADTTPPA